jgi:GT2 family glycosyltransferase
MQPTVAIILVNWNNFDVTIDCIESLKQIDYPAHTIIVVDNGSVDAPADQFLELHPDIVLIKSASNLGFTGGNNLGFQYSIEHGFDYSMMLNNDTFVAPDFLTHLINYMESQPSVGIIQPRIHFHHNRELLWNGGSYFSNWFGILYTKGFNKVPTAAHLKIKEVDWITGCAFLTRNSILQKTGLLAQNMFMYCEDVDLSFRIKAKGYQLVYHPDSVIYHIAGVSNKTKTKGKEGFANPIMHYMNQRNRIWILKKYTQRYRVPTVLICNIFYISLVLGYFAARRRFIKFKTVARAIQDGLKGAIINDPIV